MQAVPSPRPPLHRLDPREQVPVELISLANRTGPLALRALISISNTRRLCPDHHRRAFIERFRSCNNSTLIALS